MVIGDAVQTSKQPAFGTGVLLSLQPEKARVFFLGSGEKSFRPDLAGLRTVSATAAEEGVFAVFRAIQPWEWKHHSAHYRVYAIELAGEVRDERAFRLKNPLMRPDRPCLYVGGTGLTPEERFHNHRAGHKSTRLPSQFGTKLRPDIYGHFPPVTWERIQPLEPAFADLLREWGYGVWQN